mgnify:FL=1
MFGNITDVPGVKVGHKEDNNALTGCTVILTEEGATAGVDVRGSAPGTRETDLLDPVNTVNEVHAICLAGGSAFGLEAASGVMQYLEEQGVGLDVGVAKVPIVPSAILFDLAVGNPNVRPNKEMGYEAAKSAKRGMFKMGNVGAGCGATVGKLLGFENAMKSGLGSASVKVDELIVGAIVAVNAVGDVRDPNTNEILAGTRHPETRQLVNSEKFLREKHQLFTQKGTNTTIGVVAVNAKLTKAEAKKIAQVTQNALARTIAPVHTTMDGDTIFTLGTGDKVYPIDIIASLAIKVMEEAIIRAVKEADSTHDIDAWKDLK